MKTLKVIWVLPLLGTLAIPAAAGNDSDAGYRQDRFEQRLDRQHWRIKQGIRNGELTRKEAKRLRRQHRHIARLTHRFDRDGHLDRLERRTLQRELDAASERIYRLKHNDRYRGDRHDKHQRHDDHGRLGGHPRKPHRYDHHDAYEDNRWSVTFSLWDKL